MTDTLPEAVAPVVAEEPIDLGLSVFDVYETDSAAEETGRWFDLLGEKGKGEIKLRGFASKPSLAARRRLEATFRRHMGADGSYPIEIMHEMTTRQLAEGIIVDWRGPAWRGKDGVAMPYSPASALDLMTRVPHLRMKIASLAGDLDTFRFKDQEAVTKN